MYHCFGFMYWLHHVCAVPCRGQKKMLGPLGLELQMDVSCHVGAGNLTQIVFVSDGFQYPSLGLCLCCDYNMYLGVCVLIFLYGVLQASCTWVCISFLGFGEFSSMILLETLTVSFSMIFLSFFMPQIQRFSFLIVQKKAPHVPFIHILKFPVDLYWVFQFFVLQPWYLFSTGSTQSLGDALHWSFTWLTEFFISSIIPIWVLFSKSIFLLNFIPCLGLASLSHSALCLCFLGIWSYFHWVSGA